MMVTKPVTALLVKPAGPSCNLTCEYCFYRKKQSMFSGQTSCMSDAIVEKMLIQLLTQTIHSVSIGWQGGEPTLMGLDFFERAVKLMQRYGNGKTIANALQTNGLLIDESWADFLKEYHFLVGLSLDGPQHIHDHYRKTITGEGSFTRVFQAAKLLLDRGVEVNVLSVVNAYSVNYPEEIYHFYKSQGLKYIQFIPCLEKQESSTQLAPFSITATTYGRFLCDMFDLWWDDYKDGSPATSIRFFESVLLMYAGYGPTECTVSPVCGYYLMVEHNGDVYPCDFYMEEKWKLGNLLTAPLVDLMNSQLNIEFAQRKSKLPIDCFLCKWRALCRGGCPRNRWKQEDGRNRNTLCSAYKQFFTYTQPKFLEMAKSSKNSQIVASMTV